MIGWWIFAVIMFAAYAVTLRPFLASGKIAFRYSGIEDMLENEDFKLGFVKGGSTYQLMKVSLLKYMSIVVPFKKLLLTHLEPKLV